MNTLYVRVVQIPGVFVMSRSILQALCPVLSFTLLACGAQVREDSNTSLDGVETPDPPPRVLSVTPPSGQACSVDAAGDVLCFSPGATTTPVLRDGTKAFTSSSTVLSVSGRNRHSCAVLSDGTAHCWGGGVAVMEAVLADPLEPPRVANLEAVAAISAGRSHSCALSTEGDVYCWGSNAGAQLGAPTASLESNVPLQVSGLDRAVLIAAGGDHSCAIVAGGYVACWGDNPWLQLGVADIEQSLSPIVLDRQALALDTGLDTTCVVQLDRRVACWGADFGSQSYTADARVVEGIANAIDVAVGRDHACALLLDGSVSCWGNGNTAQLGNGVEPTRRGAETVAGLASVNAIAAGGDVTCARLDSGEHMCWGGYFPQPDPNLVPAGS